MGTEDSTALGRKGSPSRRGSTEAFVRSRHAATTVGSPAQADAAIEGILDEPRPEFQLGPVPLLVCGLGDAELNGHVPAARRVEVMGLHRALRQGDPPHVVVLGDEALQRLNPAPLGPYLRGADCASFGVARECPPHVVAEWARACPIEFVPGGQLPRRLAVACRLDGMLHVDDEDPASTGRRAQMRRALLVLQRTGDLHAKTWARDLGISRHALRRLCAATLGFTPKVIAWSFFHVRVRREVLHGRNDEQIAFRLGFANAYALRRAYALRGVPFPRR